MIAYWQVYCNKIMAVINFMKMIKKILYTLALATIFSWVTTDLYAQKKTEIQCRFFKYCIERFRK